MLGVVVVGGYVAALAGLLVLGLGGRLGAPTLGRALGVLGALTALSPLVALTRHVQLPTLFFVVALGFGGAALVGGIVAARMLSR